MQFCSGRLARHVLAWTMMFGSLASASETKIVFNRDIRPILVENCFHCHGPDRKHRQADLRLDDREAAIEAGAVTPGNADNCEMIRRIENSDRDERMPPADSHKQLTDAQKRLLRQWVQEGAVYQRHWAYESPMRPKTPPDENAIDWLVRKRLAASGLSPSPGADRRTLIRRLCFDLLGIPPSAADVAQFEADHSEDAYERLVDRLLESPHFGERMAQGWLDVVRYADTIGYHSDNPRNVWPYRDYVIDSFNRNKPFDQFTIEQLAGDLLPNSTQEQKIASCYNRLLLTTEEGGAQDNDYLARMLTDRVRAIGTVWLGQTLGCCQCHDHKFDPATIKDFYSMGAFFADIEEPPIGPRGPGLPVPSAEQAKKWDELKAIADELRDELAQTTPDLDVAQRAWELAVRAEATSAIRWTELRATEAKSMRGTPVFVDHAGALRVDAHRARGRDTFDVTLASLPPTVTGVRLEVLPRGDLPQGGPGMASDGRFVLSKFELIDREGRPVEIKHASATWEASGFPASSAIGGHGETSTGWSSDLPNVTQAIYFELAQPLEIGREQTLTARLHQRAGDRQLIGFFRFSATSELAPIRAPNVLLPAPEVVDLIKIEFPLREPGQRARVAEQFRAQHPPLDEARRKLWRAEQATLDYQRSLPHCLVSSAMPEPRTVRILPRGNWMDESGKVVFPAVPHYLPQPPVEANRRLTRLDLANWIVSRDNPLPARVFANRLWKQFFGAGLSKSLDDFGSQGEWPTNPELLDWLACEFVESGWNVKHLVRMMVMSETYCQTSVPAPEMMTIDPDNRLLARQSRYRLDAELVRDNALAVSGLLVPDVGGPSVKPYQPEGYWEYLNFPPRTYVADTGANQYRRGLYCWWQRSFLHPSMLALDAPTREECAADRTRSNIPQQALVLLNDPTYVEAARVFAARLMREGGEDLDRRIDWAWRTALSRSPDGNERKTARRLYEKHLQELKKNPREADRLLKIGQAKVPEDIDVVELAAWTSVARVIFNLHEMIVRQ